MAWPPGPTLPIHQVMFFPPRKKKVLKGKPLVIVEEVKQEMAEALKGIKINEFKTWAVENDLIGVLHQMEGTLKVTEV